MLGFFHDYSLNLVDNKKLIYVLTNRQLMKQASDKSILSEESLVKYNDLDEISNIPDGRFSFRCENYRYECLLQSQKTGYMYVFFNGSRGSDIASYAPLPRFGRWSWGKLFHGTTLNIEDPMLYKYPNLNLGWYYGEKQRNCILNTILQLVKKITDQVNAKKIIFYGSSGGGYAALQAASMLSNSLAIAINPQIYPQNWGSANEFENITGINLNDYDPFDRNATDKLIQKSQSSKFFIIQNTLSPGDLKYQFFPFCSNVSISPNYGLSLNKNILTWLYATPGGHSSVENKQILWFILNIALEFLNNKKFSLNSELIEQYNLLSDIWFDQVESETRIKQRKSTQNLAEYAKNGKKLFNESRELCKLMKYEEAKLKIIEALSYDSLNYEYRLYFADILRKLKLNDECENQLKLCEKLSSESGGTYFIRSLIYSECKLRDKAIECARAAVERENFNLKYRNHYVNLLRERQELEVAEAIARESLIFDPLNAWANIQYSRVLANKKDYVGAVKYAEEALKIEPNNETFISTYNLYKSKL